jgi:hypothetical protein
MDYINMHLPYSKNRAGNREEYRKAIEDIKK